MIRFLHCVKRRPDLTVEEFRQFWNSPDFSALLDRMSLVLGAVRVERNLTLMVEANVELMEERASDEPFDSVLEVWWDNARQLTGLRESSEVAGLLKEMTDYQRQFVDFAMSRRFFTEWESDQL